MSSLSCAHIHLRVRLVVVILIILISLSSVKCSTTNNLPKALNQRSKRILIGVGAAVGLTGFKLLNDGPVFDESTSLNGKVIAITGGNTGLGKEAAIKLASLGAQILILSRPSAKTDAAVNEIKQLTGNNNIQSIPLDLSDLSSVTSCAREVTSKVSKLDVLMNNAGVMAIPERETTRNGFEKQLGVNHLGHFLLTSELMPLLKKAGKARVINVSSTAHLFSKLDKNDLMLKEPGAYQPWIAYGNSKLANILFTRKLAATLKEKNSDVIAVSCHPGACRTELGRYILDTSSIPSYALPLLAIPALPLVYFTKSAKQGAQTQIYLAASSRVKESESGLYFDNSRPASPSAAATNSGDADWLWSKSEALTGKSFQI